MELEIDLRDYKVTFEINEVVRQGFDLDQNHPLYQGIVSIPYHAKHLDSAPKINLPPNYKRGISLYKEYIRLNNLSYEKTGERINGTEAQKELGDLIEIILPQDELSRIIKKYSKSDLEYKKFSLSYGFVNGTDEMNEKHSGYHLDADQVQPEGDFNLFLLYEGEVTLAVFGIELLDSSDAVLLQIQGGNKNYTDILKQLYWRNLGIEVFEKTVRNYSGLQKFKMQIQRYLVQSTFNNKNLKSKIAFSHLNPIFESFDQERIEPYRPKLIIPSSDAVRKLLRKEQPDINTTIHRFQQNYDHPALKSGYLYDPITKDFIKLIT